MTRYIQMTQPQCIFGVDMSRGVVFPVDAVVHGVHISEEMADEMVRSGHAVDVEVRVVD